MAMIPSEVSAAHVLDMGFLCHPRPQAALFLTPLIAPVHHSRPGGGGKGWKGSQEDCFPPTPFSPLLSLISDQAVDPIRGP